MSEAPTAVVTMRCRAGADASPSALAVEQLADALGQAAGVQPRAIGAFAALAGDPLEDLAGARGCLLEAGGQLEDALRAGRRPLLVAADAAIALATLPTLTRLRPDARVLWLSSSSSFQTPQSAPDARLADMALAGACGRWDSGLDGAAPGERVVLCGVGLLSGAERASLAASGVTVIGTTLETLVYLQNALDGAAVYVHLDLDVLSSPGRDDEGFGAEKLFDLLDAVADSCEVLGAEVCGLPAPAAEAVADRDELAGLLAPLLR